MSADENGTRSRVAGLSKSKFIMGIQCHKRLYLYSYHPELRTKPDEETLAAFARGDEVGELAWKMFPGGKLVNEPYYRHEQAEIHTRQIMEDVSVPAIFEGAFTHENIGIRADVLQRISNGGWRLIEVKSSYRLYDTHVMDLAVQAYVTRRSGVTVTETCLLLRNGGTEWDGTDVGLAHFFRTENLTDRVKLLAETIPAELAKQTDVLARMSPPAIAVGPQCTSPYRCDFFEHCHEAAD